MIFLRDALENLDCPICLQSLGINIEDASASNSPFKGSQNASSSVRESTILPQIISSSTALTSSSSSTSVVSFAPGISNSTSYSYEADHPTDENGENLVVVLPCGHFMHWLCGIQLYEYSGEGKKASCPVCRERLASKKDLVLFQPQLIVPLSQKQTHPAVRGHGHETNATLRKVSSSSLKRSREKWESGEQAVVLEDETVELEINNEPEIDDHSNSNEVTFVRKRTISPSKAYMEQLKRLSQNHKNRVRNVQAREQRLKESKKQLEEECAQLSVTVAGAKERMQALYSKNYRDSVDMKDTLERLERLRRVCKETKLNSDAVAEEIGSSIRENAELMRQIDKYERKIKRLEDSQNHS